MPEVFTGAGLLYCLSCPPQPDAPAAQVQAQAGSCSRGVPGSSGPCPLCCTGAEPPARAGNPAQRTREVELQSWMWKLPSISAVPNGWVPTLGLSLPFSGSQRRHGGAQHPPAQGLTLPQVQPPRCWGAPGLAWSCGPQSPAHKSPKKKKKKFFFATAARAIHSDVTPGNLQQELKCGPAAQLHHAPSTASDLAGSPLCHCSLGGDSLGHGRCGAAWPQLPPQALPPRVHSSAKLQVLRGLQQVQAEPLQCNAFPSHLIYLGCVLG